MSKPPREDLKQRAEKAFQGYLDRAESGEAPQRERYLKAQPAEIRSEVGRMLDDYDALRERLTGETMQLEAGMLLDDFRLIKRIGRGGMGVVWEAEQLSLGRSVALKLLSTRSCQSLLLVRRFDREACAGMQLEHPGIVKTYATGNVQGEYYIAQELIPGGFTLDDSLVELRNRLNLPRNYYRSVAELFIGIADALQHAHEAGITHRDVKPSNILLTEDQQPKVADFGLAHVEGELRISRTGDFLGTPFYVSPEQVTAKRVALDFRTDIFSLGATLYEALTLRRAFDGDTSHQVLGKILHEDPAHPRKIRSQVPRDLAVICMKALEKRPQRRYQSMKALAEDLRRFLKQDAILAKPVGGILQAARWVRRHPVATVLLAAIPAVAILGTWTWMNWDEVQAQWEEDHKREANRHLEAGYLFIGQGQPERARLKFEESMAVYPTPEGVVGMAVALRQMEGLEAVQTYLNSQAELEKKHPELRRLRASMFRARGEAHRADELLAILKAPTTALGWFLEGQRQYVQVRKPLGFRQDTEALKHVGEVFHKAILLSEAPNAVFFFEAAESLGRAGEDSLLLKSIVETMLAHWPDSPAVAFVRGFAFYNIGAYEQSLVEYRRCSKLDPEYAGAYTHLGLSLKALGNFDGAVAAHRKAIGLDPELIIAYHNLGEALSAQRRYEEAIAWYREALRMDPDVASTHNGLANALSGQGKYDEAIAAFREALRLESEYPDAYTNMGIVFSKQGKYDEAIAAHREALRLDPDLAGAHHNLASTLLSLGRYGEAMASYREALRLDPQYVLAHFNLGKVFLAQGRLDEAITAFREALRLDPKFAEAHIELGSALARQNRLDEAIDEIREGVRLDPERALFHYNLGVALVLQGRLDEAIAAYREAARLDPEDAKVHYNLGVELSKQKKVDEAIAEYREALRLNPQYVLARNNLGLVLARQRRFDEAIVEFREALKVEPKNFQIQFYIGLAFAKQGKLEEAIAEYRKALELDPESAVTHAEIGLLLCRVKRCEEALVHLRNGQRLGGPQSDLSRRAEGQIGQCEAELASEQELERAMEDLESVREPEEALRLARIASQRGKPQEVMDALWVLAQELATVSGLKLDPILDIWNGASTTELNTAAWQLVDPGRADETDVVRGLIFAKTTVSRAPESPGFRDTLAWALFANGRYEEALEESRQALKLAPAESKGEFEAYLRRMERMVKEAALAHSR